MNPVNNEYAFTHGSSAAIDGDTSTNVLSGYGTNQWISVQVPRNTPIGQVAVYNAGFYQGDLSPF